MLHLQPEGAASVAPDDESEANCTEHAAWEMFEIPAVPFSRIIEEGPSLDSETTNILDKVIKRCLRDQDYSLFWEAPGPDDMFPMAGGGGFDSPMGLLTLLPTYTVMFRHISSEAGPSSGAGNNLAF